MTGRSRVPGRAARLGLAATLVALAATAATRRADAPPWPAGDDELAAAAFRAAIGALLERNGERGPIYVADRIRTGAGGLVAGSALPGRVVRELRAAGIDAHVLAPAEQGYRAPDAALLVVLGEARFGPESRIAELWFEVGSGARIHSRVEFTLKRIEGAWRQIGRASCRERV